ncbi:MAG: S8/S53 family peptidase [Actinobacteria bacterium]|nr:S8/S53 family peptidase [Actinomycetota bacterium]
MYDTYEEAYAADLEVWQSLEIDQWYWIPGTNIIGAVCDGSTNAAGTPPPVSDEAPCIHDEHGHGTGTTSSVLSEAPNALLLVHEGNSGASALASAPVTADIQSHSWGPPAPLPLHAGDPVTQPLFGLADQGADREETIFFIAAGNGAPFPTIVDSSRVHPRVQIVGGGFPGKATTSSWSLFDYASWYCRPTAIPRSVDGVRPSYCGTSFSAPTVAGTAAAALLQLRQAEGYTGRSTADMVTPTVSREAFIDALRSAATYAPGQRFDNEASSLGTEVDHVEGQEHLFWGYGFLDASRVDAIVACAAEDVCPSKSTEAETWNEARQEARRLQTEPLLPNGSGGEAPAPAPTAFVEDPAG